MSAMLRKLNERWTYGTDRDIMEIANVLRYAMAYEPGRDHCPKLVWDMHLIAHKDDLNPHAKSNNRFARLRSTHPTVKNRVGDALAFYEHIVGEAGGRR